MTAQEMIEVMRAAKELGLTSFKAEGVEFTIGVQVADVTTELANKATDGDIYSPLSVLDEMDEDEVLYYSTPYWDELQAAKEAMKAQRKEDEQVEK